MLPTQDQIKAWTTGRQFHPYYEKSVEYENDMRVHALGTYPKELIEERRPNESVKIHAFRKKIFISPTLGTYGKVSTSLSKIRKSSDYNIVFPSDKNPSTIAEDETLETYCIQKIPTYKSVDNWFWSICFNFMLMDANGIVVVMPTTFAVAPNEYIKPYPVNFSSTQIIDYVKDQWYFVKSDEVSYFQSGNRKFQGEIYYYIDGTEIHKLTQINSKGDYKVETYVHNIGMPPVVTLRGVVEKDNNFYSLNRSRLYPMVGWLKEAVREYSDLQAGVLQSMFPSYWYYEGQECKKCKGTGELIKKGSGAPIECEACHGFGNMPVNPYEVLKVKAASIGGVAAPTPPGGILEKDTKVIGIQDARVAQHLYAALSTVNMEHLASTPLNQSGTAKEWDRSEANNFVYAVAEDAVRIMDETIYLINEYRYSFIVSDKEKRKAMLPIINVPVKYDIATDETIANDIMRMKDAKFNQLTIAAAEAEFIARRFISDKELRDLVLTVFEVDGLAGKAEEDIALGVANGWIRRQTAIIHSNIKDFIERAVSENKSFYSLGLEDKKAVMLKYADEQIAMDSSTVKLAPPVK